MRTPCYLSLLLFACSWALLSASEAPMGSPDYHPSPERPIGWRGDGTGAYPGATPVTSFGDGPLEKREVKAMGNWSGPETETFVDIAAAKPENIVWRTRMPAWAHSQPIIVGDKAFTTAEPHSLVCVAMDSGTILWQRSNSPFALMGLPDKEVAALEDYIARVYAARVPIGARVGNYKRLPSHSPGPWKEAYREPVLDECRIAEQVLSELVAENPFGNRAEQALADFRAAVAKVEALQPGEESKKLGKPLIQPLYDAVEWIAREHGVPCLFSWDGYIGWTFATPCSDGKRVYASMGQGQVVAYDLDGERVWGVRIPNLGENGEQLSSRHVPRVRAKHVPSPMLAGDVLIAQAPDQLVGLDTTNGRTLWADHGISVGGGYKVASHRSLRLPSGRWILVATNGTALDARTGKIVAQYGLGSHGSEGAGASISGRDDIAVVVGSKETGAFRFVEEGDQITAETLWRIEGHTSGHTPVIFNDHFYHFTARRGEEKDVYHLMTGEQVGRVPVDVRNVSPIIAGDCIFSYDSSGSRKRADQRNVAAIEVTRLTGTTSTGTVTHNAIDESEIPPDPRIAAHAPVIYERLRANPEPPEWGVKKWSPAFWGNDAGIPTGFGTGGFCAAGNRVVLRTIGSLICIGDPGRSYP